MKESIRNTSLCLLLTSITLLNSCRQVSSISSQVVSTVGLTATPESTARSCIPPVANLAYPVGVLPSANAKEPDIAPLGGWQLQASLPEPAGIEPLQLVTRPNEVWILVSNANKVFRYRTDIHEWKGYNSIDNFSVVPENLLRTNDGTLWGIGTVSYGADSNRSFPTLLSRYNETTDQFEFVRDVDGLLDKITLISVPGYISEDAGDMLWFFGMSSGGNDVGLYSFAPLAQKAEKRLSLPMGLSYAGPVIAPDGTIWFYSGGAEKQLLNYSPTTRQVQPYLGLPIFEKSEAVSSLFFDRDGRLWIDNKGWLDFTYPAKPVWYSIIPSPTFLTDNAWIDGLGDSPSGIGYGWDLPTIISQSSNGLFWFTTGHGIIRLDLKKGEWCWFTTGSSPVVEDKDKNVWIVVFDKLYKYHLEP